ncbi:glycosyltransferase family 2 protein [Paenibacillus apiarius]|uniref:Glycosyltransferase family 2 protein n=1 Tax=Paenibacillus apiarius TaxID=46240 RepID=A0ABT4DZ45_9BACL|nr:glycosyltransferase family A protein [Paenibacillus apiarius]MBN3526994.1 glycosyltransferase family 2 protein [Paenibacillus apiarius]MCY9514869.1 glycosyltransferase family 2 protein [Paenibacillus apiarius]MCY9521251.1 glycosyltransferase family 2 protein [Paenibacillus apiarius]MCY9553967.1 glycosyltransferase family 2 protein [Paenibacillus apiarius]MCY9560341.1 glycosyltransferase family 2 protein [Paenibacillus apiarius]
MTYPRMPGLVSIVITNYNKSAFLIDCLDAMLRQTYPNWEIILVDDASTDDSLKRVENWLNHNRQQLAERTFITLPLPRNIGYAGAMTAGFYLAKGEFIAVHDSDDVSHHERLERQVSFLQGRPDIELVGTNYEVFEQNLMEQRSKAGWIRYGDQIRKVYASGGHCVCHGTILMRGGLFDRIGGHTRRIEGAEDYEFIARALSGHSLNIENMPDILYYYRKHPNQRSRKYFGKDRLKRNEN